MQISLLIQDIINLKTLILFISIFALTANMYSQLNDLSIQDQWSKIEIENLSIVNSESEEFSPHMWNNYLVYVGLQERSGFSAKGPAYFDIKASILNDSMDLKNFIFNPELNSRFHEGPISWDQNNNTLYFTRANTENKLPIVDSRGRQLLQIYKAEYAQGKWENIIKMNFCTEEENYCHPAIYNNGRSMIFASSIDGGSGKMDLYKTEKISEFTWSTPTNLGKQINNPGNDWFPFVYEDYLFHATDIKDGQGLDIYMSKIPKDGKPTPAFRLPAPINSQYDDFGLVISKEKNIAYFSSNRPGGKGKDDIYKIILDKSADVQSTENQSIKTGVTTQEIKETITPPTHSHKAMSLKFIDSVSNVGIKEADVSIYVIPTSVAENFAQQLDSNSDLIILETMAANAGPNIDYSSDSTGQLQIDTPTGEQLFIVAKKIGYKPEYKLVNTATAISELEFQLVKK